jgi:AraC-like DNA-binding protein
VNVNTLAALVAARIDDQPDGGDTVSPSPRLMLFRRTQPTALRSDLYDPVVCLILQGAKEVMVGDSPQTVGPGQSLLVSHDMPVRARIISASNATPYLSLVLLLDLSLLRSLYEEVSDAVFEPAPAHSTRVGDADQGLVDALSRIVALSNDPVERRVMEPMLLREIHFRLLMAPHGGMLRQLLLHDSHASNVSRAIGRIRRDFRTPLTVPKLAQEVGMSVSSFHKHFREITANTPLQYQKELRLLEARRLLSTGRHAVTTVAYDVGYASPNQFSREYNRKFGVPPSAHLA